MGSKQHNKKFNPVLTDPAQDVLRLIEKGNYKDAVKQAKLCFRAESTSENRRLLERAYFLRARQLLGRAMPESAREVAGHLLEFGITDPELVADAAALLLGLGMTGESLQLHERIDSPEVKERLRRQVSDQAVLHPERATEQSPELREGAEQIRAALEALTAGDEAGMVERLREIPRSSPLSDWKLFARGLAAFYRDASDEAHANWDRLDPHRAPARIARVLLGRAAKATEPKGFATIEKQVFGEPVIAPLEQLREMVLQERWSEAVRSLGSLKFSLRRIDPALPARLTRVLYESILHAASDLPFSKAKSLVDSFFKGAEPLPIDPRWNRFWALLWEGPQGDPDEAEAYWRDYIKDLQQIPSFTPEDRTLAQALVLNRMAEDALDSADDLEPVDEFDDEFDDDDDGRLDEGGEELVGEAIKLLEESAEVCPTHLPTYTLLMNAHLARDEEKNAVAVANRLLERFPDHVDTLSFLARYHLNHDPARGLELIRRIRKIKPLDRDLVNLEVVAHVASARAHARKGRWEEGRAEFAAAEEMDPASEEGYAYLAKKAAFEFKAGQDEAAEALIARAQALLDEPTPLWLALEIEARRFELPRTRVKLYADRFKADLKNKGKPATAKSLAELVLAYFRAGTTYTGRDKHMRDVRTYLKKNARLKFSVDELRSVCEFFTEFPYKRDATLEDLARRGRKAYPESPYFLYLLPSIVIEKAYSPVFVSHHYDDLEKALGLAQASTDPNDAALVPEIKAALAAITGPRGFGFPFPRFGGAGGSPSASERQPSLFDFVDPFGESDEDPDDDEYDDPGPRRRR